jgi:CxxC motif-containing protein (DUF1111 family)
VKIAATLAAALVAALAPIAAARADDYGRAVFTDRRDPPTVAPLAAEERARFDLGQAVYNTTWVPAGLPRAERRDGVGPLFINASCDSCHNNGARGRSGQRAGETPNSFVMQLGGPDTGAYGHVLNTNALPGYVPEGQVRVGSTVRAGRYVDGVPWMLREPRYTLVNLAYGELAPRTVLKPRIGPALFGVGLLEAVPAAAIEAVRRSQPRAVRGRAAGRFGWQAEALSLQDQTERALEREMGLTTATRPQDDCTPAQAACRAAPHGGSPEVSADFLDALLTFQRELAVPGPAPAADAPGARLFDAIGCAQCHRMELPVRVNDVGRTIRPYTDLLVHDLGEGLADRRLDGRSARSEWRTAPLWGLAHALARGDVALLHDGRAASVEEAVLWHGGQAARARHRYLALSAAERAGLLAWLAAL